MKFIIRFLNNDICHQKCKIWEVYSVMEQGKPEVVQANGTFIVWKTMYRLKGWG